MLGTVNCQPHQDKVRATIRLSPPLLFEGLRAICAVGDGEDNSMIAYVLRLARPTTFQERLQLAAARLQRRPIVIMPHKCTMEDCITRYGRLKDAEAAHGEPVAS
jgi:hypothetical protein